MPPIQSNTFGRLISHLFYLISCRAHPSRLCLKLIQLVTKKVNKQIQQIPESGVWDGNWSRCNMLSNTSDFHQNIMKHAEKQIMSLALEKKKQAT